MFMTVFWTRNVFEGISFRIRGERAWFLPHSGGWEIGVKMEMWRTTRGRHFLRGPSGGTGISNTSLQVSRRWTK
jgi:hypothetical protein